MKNPSPWLWIGGIVGVLTMGALRFLGKSTDIFGLLAGMTVVIAVLAFLVIRYVNRKW
jgi:predicted lipid-binding transport protein (Tim44 family)